MNLKKEGNSYKHINIKGLAGQGIPGGSGYTAIRTYKGSNSTKNISVSE